MHLIAGKGGVGKTLLSWALAHHYAGAGQRTLRVELSAEDAPEHGELIAPIEQVAKDLWQIKIFADCALYEYLKLKIGAHQLLSKLWSHNLFRALSSAMPGLSDLTRLGKIWFHADKRQALTPEQTFDKIVVDMPSSGFVKRFLSVARVVSEAVKIGPIAHEATLIKDFMKEPDNAVLHLVVLPEELIVNESLELYEELKDEEDIGLGGLFINRVIPIRRELESPTKLVAVRNIVDFFNQKIANQNRQLERLCSVDMPHIIIEEQFGEVLLSPIVKALSEQINAKS